MNHALLLLLAITSIHAWSYVPITSSNLVGASDFVVVGNVVSMSYSNSESQLWTQFQVNVTSWLKNREGSIIEVSIPGGLHSSGQTLVVTGAPQLSVGQKAILFLKRVQRADGSIRNHVTGLAQGFFVVVDVNGVSVAIRPYEASQSNANSDTTVRRAANFADWIVGVVSGSNQPEPLSNLLDLNTNTLLNALFPRTRFNTMKNSNGVSLRWRQFDSGQSVNWYRDPKGQPNLSGGGLIELQQAFGAWNGNPNTPVSYQIAGNTTSTNGLTTPDGVNSVVYEDPTDYIPGSFDCQRGGTLAVGGFWYGSATHTFRGATWVTISEGDTIVQDGIACYFNAYSNPSATYSNVITHEIGHTLGMGHSCGDSNSGSCTAGSAADNAIMRAYARPNGGYNLAPDDNQGIEFIYSTCYPNCPSSGAAASTTKAGTATPATTRGSVPSTTSAVRRSTTGSTTAARGGFLSL